MKRILPIIVLSQFFCTSLWFAGNAVMPDIAGEFNLEAAYLAHLTSIVQLGFITGTLVFAIFNIADLVSPSKVFFFSSVIAAAANLGIGIKGINVTELMLLRFLTGFFLAGIYPVGMKIASDYYRQGLGRSLGFLVGALVLGTAFPHLVKGAAFTLPWRYVIYCTSLLCVFGGIAILLFVPDGPFRKKGTKLDPAALLSGFKQTEFRAVAFGYFGHMWELYTFWMFVPAMLTVHQVQYHDVYNVPEMSFLVIASGSIACFISGIASQRFGAKRTAAFALVLSGICCLASPLLFLIKSTLFTVVFMVTWGMAVIADSPLFSTLVANSAPAETRGTSLTIVTCIGFAITIASIQLLNALKSETDTIYIYMLLAAGPVLGLIAMLRNRKSAAD